MKRKVYLVTVTLVAGVILSVIAGFLFWQRGGVGQIDRSIAVLPFENLGDAKAYANFADGIQDEILTKLSRISDLKVISRTSTAKYKSKPDDLKAVAQELGVAHVLKGSVLRKTDRVQLNVQVIDTRSGNHLWTESYDRELKDVFVLESEVS